MHTQTSLKKQLLGAGLGIALASLLYMGVQRFTAFNASVSAAPEQEITQQERVDQRVERVLSQEELPRRLPPQAAKPPAPKPVQEVHEGAPLRSLPPASAGYQAVSPATYVQHDDLPQTGGPIAAVFAGTSVLTLFSQRSRLRFLRRSRLS